MAARMESLFVVRDLDALGGDDGVEHAFALQGGIGFGLRLVYEVVDGLARDLGVALGVDALGAQAAGGDLPHLVGLGVDQVLRHVHLGLGHRGVHDAASRNSPSILWAYSADALLDVSAQVSHALETARVGGEAVELGQALLLDLLHGGGKHRVAAAEVLGRVVVGEAHGHVALLAGHGAHEAVLEAGHEPTRAELEHEAASSPPSKGSPSMEPRKSTVT